MTKHLTREKLVDLLKKKQGDRSASDLANELGVTPSYLSEIFSGKRNPGPKVLEQLGLTAEIVYQQER
jgi:transcriptional regulator with XRE-family HTH domain